MRFWRPTLVVALLAASVAVAVGHAGTPSSTFVVDTLSSWDGSSTICLFGYPDTATYGQTITVPDGYPVLKSFSFLFLVPKNNSFRGELYAWDGDSATGDKIWASQRKHTRGSQPTVVTFRPGATLTPGNQYVIFASISKDYANSADGGAGCWGRDAGSTYSGGEFFYQNNGGDPSTWTQQPWSDYSDSDVAFKAVFHT